MNCEFREEIKSTLIKCYFDAMAECDRADAEGVLLGGFEVDVRLLAVGDPKEEDND